MNCQALVESKAEKRDMSGPTGVDNILQEIEEGLDNGDSSDSSFSMKKKTGNQNKKRKNVIDMSDLKF